MPALFEFLLKVNIALLLFCGGYFLVLRHLTFYSLNRVYLVTAILFATVYPEIDLSAFALQHEHLAQPVQTVVLYWEAPAHKLTQPLLHPNYWQWATLIFWTGAALLGLRLLVQLFSLFRLHRSSKPAIIHNHQVRMMSGQAAPFSFWRNIYVNPANHHATDLKAILLHEQVHVNGWHTIDILLAELSSIFYWFNPGVWLMKKAVRENIEFITDRKILNKGIDSKTYQYSLVNVSFGNHTPGIVNHFNISTIKKRIIMMNAKRSSKFTLTRYAFIIPAVVALLLTFSLSKAGLRKPVSAGMVKSVHPVIAAVSKAIHKADTIIQNNINKPEPAKVYAFKNDTGKVRSFTVTMTDTNKKQKLMFINGSHLSDSANLVVNGKKIKSSEFKNIDPDKILAINVMTAEKANKILVPSDHLKLDNNKQVVFITTKDSEAGKSLMNRLGSNKQLTDLKILQDVKVTANGSDVLVFNDVKSSSDIVHFGVLNTTMENDSPRFITVYGTSKNSPAVNADLKVNANVNGFTNIYPADLSKQIDKRVLINKLQGMAVLNGNGIATVYDIPRSNGLFYSNSSVNRISDKLIIINGKEASEKELKKISAFDIDRMEVLSNSDTIKKYGDKAKYGVVYIYTKKGK